MTMNIRRLIHIFIAFACLAMLSACYNYDQEGIEEVNAGNYYINLAISVSSGNEHSTRADEPQGGENGDGREAGFERENTITGILLILYKDATGINTTADPTLDLVRYFPVTLESRDAQGTEYTTKTEEAYYTTGNQPLGSHKLDMTATYHAIVIANAAEVAASLVEGTSKLSAIRDAVLNTIYVGNPTMTADKCTNFVMSSEADNTINFGSVTATNLDGSAHIKGQDMLFDVSGQPIVIERLAARIDFWSANSNGYKTSTENPAYTIPGYEYPVWKSTDTSTPTSNDRFVVTGIVPFNLNNGHATYGSEYLLKRQCEDKDHLSATAVSYLADETTSSYVIDPQTLSKTTGSLSLTSPLSGIYALIGSDKIESTTDNPYYHSVAAMRASSTGKFDLTVGSETAEDVIVAYPMENTLLPTSELYYYATGIAIVGYYYKNGTGTGTRYVYLGYLRHQGEAASYDIQPYTTPLTTTETMGTTPAMKFGIVRNNIYRVSIGRIDEKGTLELSIKVKKWDPYTHDFIYM